MEQKTTLTQGDGDGEAVANPIKYLKTELSEELHRAVKSQAAAIGSSLNDYVVKVLREATERANA